MMVATTAAALRWRLRGARLIAPARPPGDVFATKLPFWLLTSPFEHAPQLLAALGEAHVSKLSEVCGGAWMRVTLDRFWHSSLSLTFATQNAIDRDVRAPIRFQPP